MLHKILIFGFIALSSTIAFGQTAGRHYWTRTVLATEATCKLRIGDSVFSPGESECAYYGHLAADTRVFLKSIARSKPWAKLKLKSEAGETFIIEISNQNNGVFDRIFDSFFASEASDEDYPDCNGTVLKDFITSVGFPDTISRTGNEEHWSLSYGHLSTRRCGFEIATLRFVHGELESVFGEI